MVNSFDKNSISIIPSNRVGVNKDIRGLVEKGDRPDLYRVRFSARSNFVATLSNARKTSNMNLEVLDSSGKKVIAAARRLAGRPEQITLNGLAPGTYYVRPVLALGKFSRYRLRVNTTPISDTGDTPSTGRFLDLTSPVTVGEFIGAEDRRDLFSFTVGASGFPTGQLNLNLTGEGGGFLDGNVTLTLRDSSLKVVRQKSTGGRVGFTLDETLAAGTYFVEVEPALARQAQETNYQLTLATTAIPDLAGNTPNAARQISLDANTSLFQDFVGTGDQQDYYRFTVPKSNFNLQLTGPNGNLLNGEVTVRLRNEVNSILEQQTVSGGAGIAITNKALEPGTYIAQISSSSKFVNYNLLLSAAPTE